MRTVGLNKLYNTLTITHEFLLSCCTVLPLMYSGKVKLKVSCQARHRPSVSHTITAPFTIHACVRDIYTVHLQSSFSNNVELTAVCLVGFILGIIIINLTRKNIFYLRLGPNQAN